MTTHEVEEPGAPSAGPERVVVIDDDYAMRLSCRQILVKSGFEVETYEDGARGLAAVAAAKPALVVVDLKMPGLSGMDVIRRVQAIDPTIVLIVITGYATIGTAVEAMQAGAYDFLPKPFKPDELRLIVNRGLERRRLMNQTRELELERELMKRRFVSFVSHQLKSPLAAVQQYLEVLRRLADAPDVESKRDEWVGRCLTRIREMRGLIDDWLTVARAEGEALVGERSPVALAPVLERLVDSHRSEAEDAGVTVAVVLPPALPPVAGDRNCVSVLLENLLSNAIAYNRPGGTVTLRCRAEAGEVVVEVADTGVGIPAASLGRLFEEFYRVPSEGDASRPSGTGLGLPICRRIASELGGAIDVESEEGTGSVFRVRIPAFQDGDTAPADAEEMAHAR